VSQVKALIIINKLARQGQSEFEDALEVIRQGGIDFQLNVTDRIASIPALIRDLGIRSDLVILGGGDGTFNAALEAVLKIERPLGILPLGTANDLARSLGIGLSAVEAARIIVQGNMRRIDLGWVNGKHYFNVASIGLAASMRPLLTHSRKQRWGVLAYPISIVSAYRNTRPFRARIRSAGRIKDTTCIQMAVGNGRHYGGGLVVHKESSIDDHLLNLYCIKPQPFKDLIRLLPAIKSGTFSEQTGVWVLDGAEFSIVTDRRKRISADGEIVSRTPARFKVMPARLPVFAPSGS
jgi:diacylglycerol kinase (ATP)